MRRFLSLALASTLLAGCAGSDEAPERGPRTATSPTPQHDLGAEELRRLRELAEASIVGTVESYDDTPTGRTYAVRVSEVLSRQPSLDERAATHPLAEGETIHVSTFLFRDVSQSGEIGPLDEFTRYIFFLSPEEDPGEWLNLEDPAALRLPAAQATLDALRALRDRAAEGAPRTDRPAEDRPPG